MDRGVVAFGVRRAAVEANDREVVDADAGDAVGVVVRHRVVPLEGETSEFEAHDVLAVDARDVVFEDRQV